MKWLVVAGLVMTGCQTSTPAPAPVAEAAPPAMPTTAPTGSATASYTQDITNLCEAVHLSGADAVNAHAQQTVIAMWLGKNLVTQQGREFLVKIQPLVGLAKAEALDAEAKRVGLDRCALSSEWR